MRIQIKQEVHGLDSKKTEEDVFDVRGAARFLKCAVPTVYAYVERKAMPHIKMGTRVLFKRDDLLSWLDTMRKNPVVGQDQPEATS